MIISIPWGFSGNVNKFALFGGGYSGGAPVSTTSVYTYASNTAVAGGNLSYTANGLAAAGNSVVGVFGGGNSGSSSLSTTSVYTYSSNTAVAGGNLSYSAFYLAACAPNTGVNS